MKTNILIDPYMFCLTDDATICDNIDFFNKIIRHVRNDKITLCIYKKWHEDIMSRTPFPIRVEDIRDHRLKELVLNINDAFYRFLPSQLFPVEIDVCAGSQDLNSNCKELLHDDYYYELLSALLTECYTELAYDSRIFSGNCSSILKIDDKFSLSCSCQEGSFDREYRVADILELDDPKDIALDELMRIIAHSDSLYINSPEIVINSDHHDPTQNKTVNVYSDLDSKTRRVLDLLRFFGLNKIILKEYNENSSKAYSTIAVKSVQEGTGADIINGDLYYKSGWKRNIDMYFPKGIGKNLPLYVGDTFDYQKILKLKDILNMQK